MPIFRDYARIEAKAKGELAVLQMARALRWTQKKMERELDVLFHYIDLQLDGPFWTDDD